ncbi:hypothetical protein [Algiphilus aromaticivorans]|uniref:hypothetical protein n=1 Tax=Algiphilus aromaticivorans TaxID=382454 RepID=UPI0005C19135|nr:hypothetical protein [Algiphilus aromaticivorans]
MKQSIKLHSQCAGFFKLEAVKRDGTRRLLAEFENLITDFGLDLMGTSNSWLRYCHVGSGSDAPNANDTTMASLVATTNTKQSSTGGNQSSAPYYRFMRNIYRFGEGVAAGNLAEVGVGINSSGNADYAFSRALILDGNGDPTTITILSDETLDVTYEFRMYPPTVDTTGQIELRGTTHDYTARAANVDSGSSAFGWTMGEDGLRAIEYTNGGRFQCLESGASLAAITGRPSANSSTSGNSASTSSYVNGTYERSATITWGIDTANFPSGIGGFLVQLGWGAYQFVVSPDIDKTDSDELTIEFSHSWGRKT